ncbi:MAG: septum formation initiator family protein [Oscillospiraceae bacterium]
MGNTKKQKNKGLTSLLMKLGISMLGLYLVISLITVQVDIVSKRHELAERQVTLQEQIAQNTELRRTLENSSTEETIERLARDKLGYARPDERVFVDMSGK